MQLKVVKADGTGEEYFHTKVIGTISNALSGCGQADICVAEQLADVVTYFLYHQQSLRTITSGEILAVIKAVLAATSNETAAIVLTEHHLERKLKRSRIEVVSFDVSELSDAEVLTDTERPGTRSRWDKSKIVNYLVRKHNVTRQCARTAASMVEEKIFRMGITLAPASLIKQLVINDTAAVLKAERQLQTI